MHRLLKIVIALNIAEAVALVVPIMVPSAMLAGLLALPLFGVALAFGVATLGRQGIPVPWQLVSLIAPFVAAAPAVLLMGLLR